MNLLKSLKVRFLNFIIKLLLRFYAINFLVFIYSILLIKKNKRKKKKTLLALIPNKFRGDLEILSNGEKFSIIALEEEWLLTLFNFFYPLKVKPKNLYNRENHTLKFQNKYIDFLKIFLKSFYKKNRVSAVITADVRYVNTIDFCSISKRLNVPWIVLHRENLYACDSVFTFAKARHKRFNNFTGNRIIVHNEATKSMFVSSGFVSQRKVSVAGCLRMDKWTSYTSNKLVKNQKRKKVTLFSFVLWRHTPYPDEIFTKTHEKFIEFAIKNPTITFIIRPKPIFLEKTDWLKKVTLCNKNVTARNTLPNNLIIDSTTNTHNLIKDSIFVVGLNSTVLLEAAITNIPVIIPYFDRIRKKSYNNKIYFFDYLDCFDLPRNENEMFKIFKHRMQHPQVNKYIQNRRKILFEKYVSKFNVNSLKLYEDIIFNEINVMKV